MGLFSKEKAAPAPAAAAPDGDDFAWLPREDDFAPLADAREVAERLEAQSERAKKEHAAAAAALETMRCGVTELVLAGDGDVSGRLAAAELAAARAKANVDAIEQVILSVYERRSRARDLFQATIDTAVWNRMRAIRDKLIAKLIEANDLNRELYDVAQGAIRRGAALQFERGCQFPGLGAAIIRFADDPFYQPARAKAAPDPALWRVKVIKIAPAEKCLHGNAPGDECCVPADRVAALLYAGAIEIIDPRGATGLPKQPADNHATKVKMREARFLIDHNSRLLWHPVGTIATVPAHAAKALVRNGAAELTERLW